LAKRIARCLLSPAPEGPLFVGAGHKNSTRHSPAVPLIYATYRTPSQPNLLVHVSFPEDAPGTVGFYSATTPTQIAIQKPLTKDEAVTEAASDVERSLDGLRNSRNLGVQLAAFAAAIPMSLWKQSVGLVSGVTVKKFRSADAQLTPALNGTQPQLELAQQVAQQLTPRTSEPVLLAKNPSPVGAENRSTRMPRVATPSLLNQDVNTVLEIQVRNAALRGDGGFNPSLAFCLEARVTLFRVSDRAELYLCPVQYRGEKRKFTQWAAQSAS
jgi:hypothetical protein